MFSKIKIVVVSVVLLALAFGGLAVALGASMLPSSSAEAAGLSAAGSLPAAAGTPAPTTAAATGTHWAAGQISAIAADNFTIQGPMGGVHVVYVNSQTLYFNHDALARF